jgi:glycosyltransferase involved in cell wall biosynthesis
MICMAVTNPGHNDPRVCMEAAALAERGLRVVVIGWDRQSRRDAIVRHSGVEFRALAIPSRHGMGLAQGLVLPVFWWRMAAQVRRLKPLVVHCHDLDTLPAGRAAAGAVHARCVFDAHECYPDMMVGHLPPAAVAMLRAMERRLVPRCDALVTVGGRLAEHYRRLGAREVVVAGNWKDAGEFCLAGESAAQVRRELGLSPGAVAICFVANLGRERRIEPLMRAVAGDSRFACVIGGDGPLAPLARQYAQQHANIRYLGPVPPSRVAQVTAACDVVFYGFDPTNPNARWSTPNKLFEAVAAAKPLLTGGFGEIGQIVADTGCGVLADTESADGIMAALERLADVRERHRMGQRAASLRPTFSRQQAQKRLWDLYDRLLPGHQPGGAA